MWIYLVSATLLSAILLSQCQPDDDVDIYATEGQDKMLECQFNPSYTARNPVYYWIRSNEEEKDNVAIGKDSLDNHYRVEFIPVDGKYRLYITNTTYAKDNGRFQCKVKESGTGHDLHVQTFKVTVLILPGLPQLSPSVTATEGKAFQLACSSVGGSPDPEIQWFRGDDPTPLQGTVQAGGNKDRPTVNVLTIEPQREDDGARLVCTVNNKALEQNQLPKLEVSTVLNVNYIPRVTVQPQNPLRVERETPASAHCRVDSKPEPTSIKWNHNGRVVSNGANLSIMPTTSEDSGLYVCTADNGLGTPGQAELTVDMLYGPTIHMETKREVQENEDIVVRCNVSANPPAEVEWFKEGDPSFRATGDVLRLEKISVRSMGRYTCQARNELYPSTGSGPVKKTANATVSIWIKHQPGSTVIHPDKAVAVEGKSFTLSCLASPPGWPEPTYRWWKEVPSNTLPSGINYTINQVQTRDEGMYYCQASNELGQGSLASVELKVYQPPRLTIPLEPKLTKRLQDADFSVYCVAKAKPRPTVRWFKDGRLLSASGLLDIKSEEETEKSGVSIVKSTLKFFGPDRPNNNHLLVDDRGVYTCEFTNDVLAPVSSNMTLKIMHGPILRHNKRKVAFELGSVAILECRMQACPEPEFEWSYQTIVIGPGTNHYMVNKTVLGDDVYLSTLRLSSVSEADYGIYTCSASNSLDTSKTQIHLERRGAPEGPADLTVVNVSHNAVTLRWTKGFDGGYEETEYHVNYKSGSTGRFNMVSCGTANVCTITGLSEMTDYQFQVRAQNVQGESEFSNEVAAQTKVDASKIPTPYKVYFNKDTQEVIFNVPEKNIALVAKVEILTDDNPTWLVYSNVSDVTSDQVRFRMGAGPFQVIQRLKVRLCLRSDPAVCGEAENAVFGIPPQLAKASVGVTSQNIIIIAVCSVLGILLAVGIVLGCCCCCRKNKKEKQVKKDFEMENSNTRPKAITGPYYPEGIVNKGVDGSMDNDELNKGMSQYVHVPPPGNQPGLDPRQLPQHHMQNGGMPPGYSYLEREFTNSNGGSVDSQDSLWLKANGELSSDRAYSYDPSLSNAYLYPDEYHHMHEDMMNQRNRENAYTADPYAPVNKPKKRNDHIDTYHDVSEMPDPYMEEEEKVPHQSISFDESLESGYSTPNSRSRRVIREIIV